MSDHESTAVKTAPAPFFVGVTGYMELVPEETEPLQERLLQLFDFLRHGARGKTLDKLIDDLVPEVDNKQLRKTYRAALSSWTGLGTETPIVVLTNLAPGVDTLVANLVLDQCKRDNFRLLCPLPFPADIYCGASTFVRVKDGRPDPGNLERQKDFLHLLVRMGAIHRDLPATATGTADLPHDLVEALQKVPREHFFTVRLKEEIDCHAAALESKFLADRDMKERRNSRYYAAGEFLTVSAHLLVAVWNGEREESCSGTSAVVEARLSGPQLDLLPTTSQMPMHHGGPVWHLLAHRPKYQVPSQPPLRLLYPYAVAGRDQPSDRGIGLRQAENIELQSERLRLLARIGENLSNFNSKTVPEINDRQEAFQKALAEPESREPCFATVLQGASPQFAQGLQHISDTRCRSSDLTSFYQRQVKRTLTRLFWPTLLAAILLHFCSHWHPQEDKEHPEKSHATSPDHLNPGQIRFGWTSLILAAGAVLYFAGQRSRKLEPHGHDTRAIAEGLRVQFFWNLAGLGKSVSANYMSRHRSELDWIRGVIRATSTPYERWAEWFAELETDDMRLRALRVVQYAWVRNQLKYFRKASHRENHKLHLWHAFGGVAALAGVLTFLKLIAHQTGPTVAGFVGLVCGGKFAILLLIATAFLSLALARGRALRKGASDRGTFAAFFPGLYDSIKDAREAASEAWNRKLVGRRFKSLIRAMTWFFVWDNAVGVIALELVSVLVPSHHQSAMIQTNFFRRFWHGAQSFAAHLPLALAAACAGSAVCHWIDVKFPTSPNALTLGIILGGVLLVVGALSVAWAEKNLHSEWAYQYSTMTGLFDAADARLEEELTKLEAIKDDDTDAHTQRKETVKRIQLLLFELGQEALEENAEWLLLHRARPLEPVMAG